MNRGQHIRKARPTPNHDHGGLIPPDQVFGRVLPGRLIIDADLYFEERVERAWKRLLAGIEENEHEQLREVLVQLNASNKREER